MPFRTRDFAIFLGSVGFLVTAIVFTASNDIAVSAQNDALTIAAVSSAENVYQATVVEQVPLDRAARLADLKQKVSAQTLEEVTIVAAAPEPVATTPTDTDSTIVLKCAGYTTIKPAWSAAGLEFAVVEGARIVYRTEPVVVSASTTVPTRAVVLQLPLSGRQSSQGSCLSDSLIGIASDGSLISNDEYAVYGVFGENTLIGYALDGFPIYGRSSRQTDSCGGTVVEGEYRYFLSSDREGVIGCYSGAAVTL